MLVHGIEGIERHGHPAVYVHQVGHLAVAPGAERAALAQRIGPGEPHRVEVHDVPALAFGVHDVERQLRGGDRNQRTVRDPLCGDAVPLRSYVVSNTPSPSAASCHGAGENEPKADVVMRYSRRAIRS